MKMSWRRALAGVLLVILAGGCSSIRTSDPGRTATEQLLLSTTADRSVAQMDLSVLADRKVFLDTSNLEAYDKGYIIGSVSDALGRQGALLAGSKDDAEVIVAIRSGAFSVDRSESLILGVPAIVVPVPFSGPMELPEVPFVKKVGQTSFAKFALFAYEKDTGRQLLSTGPISTTSYYNRWTILGFAILNTDIPEKSGRSSPEKPESPTPTE